MRIGQFRLLHLSLAVLGMLVGTARAQTDDDLDPSSRQCDLGITLALLRRPAAAESVFTSLLSRAPGDARAFNNLGNLALLRGEADLALPFYDRARSTDSTDAGIRLNEATAFLLLGEDDLASARVMDGVRRAGGVQAAARLLGLRYRDSTSHAGRAAQRPSFSQEEMLHLLRTATARVPLDSTRSAATDTTGRRANKRHFVWRPAGARSGTSTESAAPLYWKR